MGVDSKGVRRGRCKRCDCTDFRTESVKCRCGHAPTLHINLSTADSSQNFGHVSSERQFNHHGSPVDKISYSKIVSSSAATPVSTSKVMAKNNATHHPISQLLHDHNHKQPYCYKCSCAYSANFGACPCCYPRDDCENTACKNMKYYDPTYGLFSYCSPSCRDQHLLPEYNKKLREHLNRNESIGVHRDQQFTKHDVKQHFISSSPPSHDQLYTVKTDGSSGSTTTSPDKDVKTGGLSPVTLSAPATTSSTLDNDVENFIFIKSVPKEFHFYNETWSEDGKRGLYVTGLTHGEETELELGDLIFGTAGIDFKKFDSLTTMTYLVQGGSQLKLFRKYNLKEVREKINKEVKGMKCKQQVIVFLLPNKQEAKVYGIIPQDVNNKVIVSSVNEKSIAGCSGMRSGDIIHCIGGLKDQNKFSFTKVKKTEQVATVCAELKKSPSAIGLILIIERTKSTAVY